VFEMVGKEAAHIRIVRVISLKKKRGAPFTMTGESVFCQEHPEKSRNLFNSSLSAQNHTKIGKFTRQNTARVQRKKIVIILHSKL